MMRALCRLDDIPDGASRGFGPAPGGFTGLFAIRRGADAYVYVNACPHVGVALDWTPDDFLTADRKLIVCSTHGALFAIETGQCVQGPCKGDKLESVAATVEGGWILVPDDAGL
jgi:nitrite reductase/ring-hydroxylating ferredoxin subunit